MRTTRRFRGTLPALAALLLTAPMASAQGFDPSSVGDLALWLDASDASTISVDGGGVLTWADKSADANDVAANGAAQSPVLRVVDGQPQLQFDGDDYLCGGNAITDTNGLTIFAVARHRVR